MMDEQHPLPAWAIGETKDYTAIGAQLRTRDGRKIGNAVVVCSEVKDNRLFMGIITDIGTRENLVKEELISLFHEPEYVMDIKMHIGVLHRNKIDKSREEGAGKTAIIHNGRFAYELIVDGKKLAFDSMDAVEYLEDHYKSLGYAVERTGNGDWNYGEKKQKRT